MAVIRIVRSGGSGRGKKRCQKIHARTKAKCLRAEHHRGQCKWIYASQKPRPESKYRTPSAEARLTCLEMVEDPTYRKRLLRDLRNRDLRPAVECMLWYYAKGKPKEMVEHSGTLNLQQELSALSAEELATRALDIAAMLKTGSDK